MQNIVDYIPTGQSNAVTADSLCAVLNMSRREVRKQISKAQENGAVILNLQDGRGYFVPDDSETQLVENYVKQESARSRSLFRKIKSARKWCPEQTELGDCTQ